MPCARELLGRGGERHVPAGRLRVHGHAGGQLLHRALQGSTRGRWGDGDVSWGELGRAAGGNRVVRRGRLRVPSRVRLQHPGSNSDGVPREREWLVLCRGLCRLCETELLGEQHGPRGLRWRLFAHRLPEAGPLRVPRLRRLQVRRVRLRRRRGGRREVPDRLQGALHDDRLGDRLPELPRRQHRPVSRRVGGALLRGGLQHARLW
mmetsp:Transcript_66837/g.168804  ORF Transcript_66837/g.168804 Transcript_66837/m.168804 type:complete len:206 (-) Transcript_66837:802-1419(-)